MADSSRAYSIDSISSIYTAEPPKSCFSKSDKSTTATFRTMVLSAGRFLKNLFFTIAATSLILFLIAMVTLSPLCSSYSSSAAAFGDSPGSSSSSSNSTIDGHSLGPMETIDGTVQKLRFARDAAAASTRKKGRWAPQYSQPAAAVAIVDLPKSFVDTVQSSLNLSVAPCDNFYEYVCGKWRTQNPLPRDQILWTPLTKLTSQNEFVLKSVLEKSKSKKNRKRKSMRSGTAHKKAKRFYRTCMDKEGEREILGAAPLRKLIEKMGGWAMARSGFDLDKWNFQKTLQIIHNHYGIPCFFTSFVGPDPRNSSKNIFQLEFGENSSVTSLQKKSRQKNSLPRPPPSSNSDDDSPPKNPQLNYMINVARLLGAKNDSAIREMMRDVRMLEMDVHIWGEGKQEDDWKDEDSLRRSMTLAELKELCPFLYWEVYLNSALETINGTIGPDDRLLVVKPSAFKTLSNFVEKLLTIGNEGKILLSNYMIWQVVKRMAGQLSQNFLTAEQQRAVDADVAGYDANGEKWRKCVQQTNAALDFSLAAMFIRENFEEANTELPLVKKMVENIRIAFKTNLVTAGSVTWMNAEARWRAIEKVTAMRDRVGYPNFILQSSKLDTMYDDLDIVWGDHFGNVLRASIFKRKSNMAKFGQPVQTDQWIISPSTVNAFYDITKNQMMIPVGILQPPFFQANLPPSVNYGAIGTIMGHEITHGFDNTGRQFDKFGNLAHWWDSATIEKFHKEAQCMVKQYGALGVDGYNTLGENIADNGGLKAAFDAYRGQMDGKAGEKISKNSNLTHDQLFFISMAQIWCTNVNPNIASRLAAVDPHSPGFARVTVALKNFPEFSQAFNCQAGSAMNPRSKCAVW